MPVTMQNIRQAFEELNTPERISQFHAAIVKQGHKWRGKTPTIDDVAGMVFSVIAAVTRSDKPYWCGRAGSGGICAAYYLWPSGSYEVNLSYSPEIVTTEVGPPHATRISQLKAGQIVRPFKINEPFEDCLVLAVHHATRKVKFARPHAIAPMREYFDFLTTAYSRCEEWVGHYSEDVGSQEQFVIIGEF